MTACRCLPSILALLLVPLLVACDAPPADSGAIGRDAPSADSRAVGRDVSDVGAAGAPGAVIEVRRTLAAPPLPAPADPWSSFDAVSSGAQASTTVVPAAARIAAEGRGAGFHLDTESGRPSFVRLPLDASRAAPIEPFEPPVVAPHGADGDDTPVRTPQPSTPSTVEPAVAEAAARAVLLEQRALYDVAEEDVAQAELSRILDTGRGAIVVSFEQRIDGHLLWGSRVRVALSRALEPVAISGSLRPLAGRPAPRRDGALPDASHAASHALATIGIEVAPADLSPSPAAGDFTAVPAQHVAGLRSPLRVRPVYVALPDDTLVAAWYAELEAELPGSPRGFVGLGLVLDAADGRLLVRRDLVRDGTPFEVRADTDSGLPLPSPYGKALSPMPPVATGSEPAIVEAQRVLPPRLHPLGDPWLEPGTRETLGNHVDAYSDHSGDNGRDADDHRARLGASGAFDAAYDFARPPALDRSQREAPIVHMFYVVNVLHDLFYRHGFTEAMGNAQADNRGRGGLEGDRLLAESADHAGTDNANMYTPSDGGSPRLQMYVYTRTLPAQDAALDTDLVAHEWAHYLFARLTPEAADTVQLSALNEGNSDFVALLLGARARDASRPGNAAFQGAYPLATWAGRRHATGVRRAPYAADLERNPFTLAHIAEDAELPVRPWMSPHAWSSSPAAAHNAGEIWAAALWEVFVARVHAHGFARAHEAMLDDLVAALALLPPRATFLEARDALLAATWARAPRDHLTTWQALARRGFGVDAVAPARSSTDLRGVVESFALGGRLTLSGLELDDAPPRGDGDGILDRGEQVLVRARVSNSGAERLVGVVVALQAEALAEDAPSFAITLPGQVELPPLEPMAETTVELEVTLEDAAPLGTARLRVVAAHPDAPSPASTALVVDLEADALRSASACEGFESRDGGGWRAESSDASPSGGWRLVEREDAPGHYWHAPAPSRRSDASLVSPPLEVSHDAPLRIALEHRYDLESNEALQLYFDGGVLELSTDDGASWRDAGELAVAAVAYDAQILDLHALDAGPPEVANPLANRLAFGGRNPSYPLTDRVVLDFGDRLVGATVRLRLRLATDGELGSSGWELHRVAVSGVSVLPFASRVAAGTLACDDGAALCASIAPHGAVCAGEPVTLDGSPSQGAIAAAWRAVGPPEVALRDAAAWRAAFVAPGVEQASVVRLELTVRDEEGRRAVAQSALRVHPLTERAQTPVEGLRAPRVPDKPVSEIDCACAVSRSSGSAPPALVLIFGLVAALGLRARRRARCPTAGALCERGARSNPHPNARSPADARSR